jgi:hypothetical protein
MLIASCGRALVWTAYSQLTTLLKGRLSEGFVPNMWMPNWISFDRSGPPLTALVLRALYVRYREAWLVHLLYDECAAPRLTQCNQSSLFSQTVRHCA